MKTTHRLDYCGFVALSEAWEGYASSFALFPQDCFGSSESFGFIQNLGLLVIIR